MHCFDLTRGSVHQPVWNLTDHFHDCKLCGMVYRSLAPVYGVALCENALLKCRKQRWISLLQNLPAKIWRMRWSVHQSAFKVRIYIWFICYFVWISLLVSPHVTSYHAGHTKRRPRLVYFRNISVPGWFACCIHSGSTWWALLNFIYVSCLFFKRVAITHVNLRNIEAFHKNVYLILLCKVSWLGV